MGESQKILVGDWSVIPDRNLLVRGTESITIKPRSMEVLIYLANHAGGVISTEELIEIVWQGRVVSDGTIYQSITNLRQAMGDSTEEARFIETIPKRGYRLVAPVTTLVEPKVHGEAFTVGPGRKAGLSAAAILVLALAVVATRFVGQQPAQDDAEPLPNSVAVLPLINLSPDPEHAYFAAGIHESIINQLGSLRNLNVIARSSVMQYEGVRASTVASDLRVESVMEGSVRYAGDDLLITVQLINGANETQLWSAEYAGDLSDVFAIQADIATSIANALEAELSFDEQASIEAIPTDSAEASTLYMQSFNVSYDLAVELLDQAIALDPNFALAHARKAWLFTYQIFLDSTPAEAVEAEAIALQSADRALSLDPRIGLAHATLATVHAANWRGEIAEAAYERAYELTPSDAYVLLDYGRFKRYRGDYAGAIELLERARALNPNEGQTHGQLAMAYLFIKDYEEAARGFRFLDDSDVGGRIGLANSEIGLGNFYEAIQQLELVENQFENEGLTSFRLASIALAYAAAGRREDAERVFIAFEESANSRPVGDAVWAMAYLAIGEDQSALERLESAMVERVFTDLIALSTFDANFWNIPQLDEPKFRELLDGLWE